MSINRVNISGNLTRDSELRQTQSGTSILSFGMAVNDRRKNPQTDEWEDYPNYVDLSIFGARADALAKYLTKGTKVAVDGKLRWSQWERDGQKRSKLEVIVNEIEFLSRNDGQQQTQAQQPQYQQQYAQPAQPQYQQQYAQPQYQQQVAQPAPSPQPVDDLFDDSIPF